MAASSQPGTTWTVKGNIGNVTLTARPSTAVTFVAAVGTTYGQITFDGSANITFQGGSAQNVFMPSRTGQVHTVNTIVRKMTIGGTAAARTMPAALIYIQDGVDNTHISANTLHYTNAGNTGNQGYAIRAINGDRDLINGLTVANNHIDHIGSDGAQLAGVAGLVFTRNELAYIAAEPGSTEHSDSLQILSLGGSTKASITQNVIHYVGYYNEQAQPADSYPAGQLLIHGWSDVGAIFQDNLVIYNRNYEPDFKEESTGAIADNWNFNHNTIMHNGPPQPTAERAGFWLGKHAFTYNIVSRVEGFATFSPASNNFTANGSCAGCTLDTNLTFDANWLSTDHPTSGIRQVAGPTWGTLATPPA